MDATEKIYQLVKQWSFEIDRDRATLALCEIALIAGCISPAEATRGQLNERQYTDAIEWLRKNHPNIYLWAMGQHWIGHPAAIWGIATPQQEFLPALYRSTNQKTLNSSFPNPISKIHGS